MLTYVSCNFPFSVEKGNEPFINNSGTTIIKPRALLNIILTHIVDTSTDSAKTNSEFLCTKYNVVW